MIFCLTTYPMKTLHEKKKHEKNAQLSSCDVRHFEKNSPSSIPKDTYV